jgi:hypothetical protein
MLQCAASKIHFCAFTSRKLFSLAHVIYIGTPEKRISAAQVGDIEKLLHQEE